MKENLSSAVTVYSDATIAEVVRKMRDLKVSSILVVTSAEPFELLGIFTERDLLKWIDQIQIGGHSGKTVSYLMTKPVITVNIADIENAADVMVENNIRHLPVTYRDEKGRQHLAGVISMRDLFKSMVKKGVVQKELKPRNSHVTSPNQIKVGIISKDEPVIESLGTLLEKNHNAAYLKFDIEDIIKLVNDLQPLPTMNISIIDLDWHSPMVWSKVIKSCFRDGVGTYTIVIYDPNLHQANELEYLKQFSKHTGFSIFTKPINLLEFLKRLRIWNTAIQKR